MLDQVELVAERTGIDPLEVGITKLKGLALGDVNTICKEEVYHGISFDNV